MKVVMILRELYQEKVVYALLVRHRCYHRMLLCVYIPKLSLCHFVDVGIADL